MMPGMIATGKAFEIGIAVPAQLGFQAGLGFVISIDGHILDERKKSAKGRIRIEAERR
jgi:hypothetical protein